MFLGHVAGWLLATVVEGLIRRHTTLLDKPYRKLAQEIVLAQQEEAEKQRREEQDLERMRQQFTQEHRGHPRPARSSPMVGEP